MHSVPCRVCGANECQPCRTTDQHPAFHVERCAAWLMTTAGHPAPTNYALWNMVMGVVETLPEDTLVDWKEANLRSLRTLCFAQKDEVIS